MRAYKAYALGYVLKYMSDAWGIRMKDFIGISRLPVRGASDEHVELLKAYPFYVEKLEDETREERAARLEAMWNDILEYAKSLGFGLSDLILALGDQMMVLMNVMKFGQTMPTMTEDTMDPDSFMWSKIPSSVVLKTMLLPDPRLMSGWTYDIELPAFDVPKHEILPSNFIEYFEHPQMGIKITLKPQTVNPRRQPSGFYIYYEGMPFEVKDSYSRFAAKATEEIVGNINDVVKYYRLGIFYPDKLCYKAQRMFIDIGVGEEDWESGMKLKEHFEKCERCQTALKPKDAPSEET